MTGEGMTTANPEAKKRPEGKFNKIPVFNSNTSRIVELTSNNDFEPEDKRELDLSDEIDEDESIQSEFDSELVEEDELNEESEAPKYNYIGYSQDYSIDDSQSYVSVEALKTMAMDAYRANNFFLAMQYFNKILVRNPRHKEALFFKKKLLSKMQGQK